MTDLYSENLFDSSSTSPMSTELLSRFESIDAALCKMGKKSKSGKKGKKNSKKRLKKRMVVLEMEHQRFVYAMQILLMQQQRPERSQFEQFQQEPNPPWWQQALTNTLPGLLDLASNVYTHKKKKKKQPQKYFRFPSDKKARQLMLEGEGFWK